MKPSHHKQNSSISICYNFGKKGKWSRAPLRNKWFQDWNREGTRWAWNMLWCQKVKKSSFCQRIRNQLEGLLLTKSGKMRASKEIRRVINCKPSNKLRIHGSVLIINRNIKIGEKRGCFVKVKCQLINMEGEV